MLYRRVHWNSPPAPYLVSESGEARNLHNLGVLHVIQGKYEQAESELTIALEAYRFLVKYEPQEFTSRISKILEIKAYMHVS